MIKQKLTLQRVSNLIDLLNEYFCYDCSFIIDSSEYNDLNKFLYSFFGENFSYKKIVKIYSNVFRFENYIIKISVRKVPEKVPDIPEIVKVYYRKNIEIYVDDKYFSLGIEIQDYLEDFEYCNEQELYELYVRLKSRGYEWIDVNIGNAVKYNNKLLIIDTDYIYPVKDANYINQSELAKLFLKKYNLKA